LSDRDSEGTRDVILADIEFLLSTLTTHLSTEFLRLSLSRTPL
jgi:hypothetical protein